MTTDASSRSRPLALALPAGGAHDTQAQLSLCSCTQAAESDEGSDDCIEDDYIEDDYMEGDDLSPSGRRTPTWYAHTEPIHSP